MEQKNKMLRLAGYINVIIGFGHIVGLLWADQMFQVTGISPEMKALSPTGARLSTFFGA
jgi:hypothetical protein